jgi:hypothetical protein
MNMWPEVGHETTPLGWAVEIHYGDRMHNGRILRFGNAVMFAGHSVGYWTEGGARGNKCKAEAMAQADKMIGAFAVAIKRLEPILAQGVLL